MVAPASLRKRLRNLPQAKPTPQFWLVDAHPDGREMEHGTGRPWPVPEYLARPEPALDMVLFLTLGDDNEVTA